MYICFVLSSNVNNACIRHYRSHICSAQLSMCYTEKALHKLIIIIHIIIIITVVHTGTGFFSMCHCKKSHSRTPYPPLLDLLSRLSERLSGRDRSAGRLATGATAAAAGLRESGRVMLLAWRVSSTWAEGVWVSTLRVQLSRVTSGIGARWPSGISWACSIWDKLCWF